MVLLAMLVPMAVLLRSYALEDRLSRAALEVQATETVVSGQDKGAVATYLEKVNRGHDVSTTVLYPPSDLHPDGEAIGPTPGEDADVVEARLTGQAACATWTAAPRSWCRSRSAAAARPPGRPR